MENTEERDLCSIAARREGGSLRRKLSKDLKEAREQEMFFIREKSIPGRKNGKCTNNSEAGGYLLHPKKRKEARVTIRARERKRRKWGLGNRMPSCLGIVRGSLLKNHFQKIKELL